MVLLHVKFGTDPDHEFLFQTNVAAALDDVTREISRIHNMRLSVFRLVAAIKQLISYGPMKPENLRGLTPEQIEAAGDEKQTPTADPTGMRVGQPTPPDFAKVLERTSGAAEALIKNHIASKQPLTIAMIEEVVQNIKGAVTIAYPMNLPEYDVVRQILEGKEDLSGQAESKDVVDPKTSLLWFAGKQMLRDQALSKYVGANDKVKLIVKLTKKGQGAPQREPALDEEARRSMMAYYHKKQEQNKQLEEDDEDSCLNSDWANPNAFRNSVSGMSNIKFKPA